MSDLELFKSFAPSKAEGHNLGNNAVIYTRVSHSSQEENSSLESQKKYCDAFAERRGLNVVGYFGGTYESAKTDDRKEFNKLLAFVKRTQDVSYLIVYSYERFSRSGINGASIADDLFKRYGVVTLAVTQELDPTTAVGSFQRNIFLLFSQMDNEMRREKTVTGMRELMRKGYYMHGLPRGFSNLNKGNRAFQQNVVVNEEGKLIRKAFHWKAEHNMANAEICRQLKALGLDLDERRLAYIFRNPFYCGLIVSNMLPGEVIEGKQEVLVSRDIFLAANDIIADKRSHPVTHHENDINLPLKRFMKCSACDTPMTGFLVKAKNLYYYKCRTKGCCTVKSAKAVHENFEDIMESFQIGEHDIPVIQTGVITLCDSIFTERKENQKLMQEKLIELEKQLETIEEQHVLKKISDAVFVKYDSRYRKEKSDIEDKLTKQSKGSSNLKNIINYTISVCLKPLQMWKESGFIEKSDLQNFVFPKGILFNKKKGRVQTFFINPFFKLIPELARLLEGNKKGDFINFDEIPALVTALGFKPKTF
jgi:site-specific DNA recombinase